MTNPASFTRYRDPQLIRKGSTGEVYSATDTSGRRVAIKRLLPHLRYDPLEREKLAREAEIISLLHHPAFPALVEFIMEDEDYYLVMEWIEGSPIPDFFNRISDPQSRERKGAEFAHLLFDALFHLQSLKSPDKSFVGLVHCDLNPNNVLVSTSGHPKIFDFSHAVWVGEKPPVFGGTWGYMSPEQMSEEKVSSKTDLFSAGLLLYETFAGQRLITGKGRFELYKKTHELDPSKLISQLKIHPILRDIVLDLIGACQRETSLENLRSRLESYFSGF